MSYKSVDGVSPRYAALLELADTMMCIGIETRAGRTSNSRTLTWKDGELELFTAWSITIRVGHKPFRTRSITEAKKYLMGLYL